jgi:Holliday junction resolvasome RuvABC endonuclease subunit
MLLGQEITTIMALDLGTITGWAVKDHSGGITSGAASFRAGRFEGGGMSFLRFKQWLTDFKHTLGSIDAIYFEEVRAHKGVDAAHKYGGFVAHLTAWCEHHQIPYSGIPVGTIKKHITGKGNASKTCVITAVKNKGFSPIDDNEADSLALLDFVLNNNKIKI